MKARVPRTLSLALCFSAALLCGCRKEDETPHNYSMAEIEAMGPKELLHALRVDQFHTREIAMRLEKAGERDKAVKELNRLLRTRDRATGVKWALESLHVPIGYAREKNNPSSFTKPGEETDVLELAAEIDGDSLLLSWDINLGPRIFFRPAEGQKGPITMPLFAKFLVEVTGGSLKEPFKKEFDGVQGHNILKNERLLSDLGPGTYTVNVNIHAQYIDSGGTPNSMTTSNSVEVQR